MKVPAHHLRLTDRQWRFLLRQTTLYATGHINRWHWRGSLGGILPGGFDAESVASQAIGEFLHDNQPSDSSPRELRAKSRCKTKNGTTSTKPSLAADLPFKICVHRCLSVVRPQACSSPLSQIQRDLERRVRRIINRLHHRSENRLLRNEPDLAPITLDDGEATSIINLIPEPSDNPRDAFLKNESLNRFDRARFLFSGCLGRDHRLHHLFRLYCDGRSKPRELATALKLKPNALYNLQRRFLTKWNRFHKLF